MTLQYTINNGMVVNDQFIVDREHIEPETKDVIDLGYHYNNPRSNFSLDTIVSHHEMRDLIATDIDELVLHRQ